MMRKTSLVLLGAVAGVALTLVVVQPPRLLLGTSAHAAAADTYRQLNLFGDIFEMVRSHYVEKPDDSKLVEGAVNGMLNGLDPHSSYMDPKSFRDMQVETHGEFGGLAPWRTASSRWWRRSTTPRPPRPVSAPAT
jgi:carboxyl-terminal processing protease